MNLRELFGERLEKVSNKKMASLVKRSEPTVSLQMRREIINLNLKTINMYCRALNLKFNLARCIT